jgi:hypothetical protein
MKQENHTPTEAFKAFVIARKSNDIEVVKGVLSKTVLETVEQIAVTEKKTFFEALDAYERGLFGNLFLSRSTNVRAEFIDSDGDKACVEAENFANGEFEKFLFFKENDSWKLAVGFVVSEIEIITITQSITERVINFLRDNFTNLFKKIKSKV